MKDGIIYYIIITIIIVIIIIKKMLLLVIVIELRGAQLCTVDHLVMETAQFKFVIYILYTILRVIAEVISKLEERISELNVFKELLLSEKVCNGFHKLGKM